MILTQQVRRDGPARMVDRSTGDDVAAGQFADGLQHGCGRAVQAICHDAEDDPLSLVRGDSGDAGKPDGGL